MAMYQEKKNHILVILSSDANNKFLVFLKKKKKSSHDASNSAFMNKILLKIHTNEENTEVIDTGSELNVTNNHQEM